MTKARSSEEGEIGKDQPAVKKVKLAALRGWSGGRTGGVERQKWGDVCFSGCDEGQGRMSVGWLY